MDTSRISAVIGRTTTVGCAFLATTQLAWAQATPPAVEAAPVAELQEVVVTAQKRAESAQTTPIAITVYGADDIVRKGITDIQALATNDTSLNLTYGAGGESPYLTLRGISSHDTTEIGDPAVAVATDGFFENRTYGLITSLYDLERIEVLRGPQGTLYGRNATGGVVNIIAAKPTKDFEAKASVEAGNFNTLNVTGVLNLPFNDAMQMRAAFASNKHDGYRDVVTQLGAPPDGGDDEDARSARVEFAFSPIEHFSALITLQGMQIGGTGNVSKIIPFVPNPNVKGDILHTLPDLGDTDTFATYSPTFVRIDDKAYKLELNYDGLPGGAKLVYLSGYDNLQWHHSLPLNTFAGEPFTTSQVFLQNEYPKTQNHELRLVSPSGGMFTWQAGLYFFQERSTDLYSHAVLNPGATNAREMIAFLFPVVEDISRAAYGQASVSITDELKLTAGVRYTKDAKERTGVFNLNFIDVFGIPQQGSATFSKVTGHVGLDWTPGSHSFEYAKVDTGYKAGGFTTCNPYGPEQVTAYEVGSKNRLFGNTVQLNVSAFYNNYRDQQISTFVPSSVCISNSTVQNAGGSHIYGLEGEFDALLDPVGKLDLSFTYLHARFTNFVAAPGLAAAVADCTPEGATGNCQLAGNTLSQSPTLTIAAGLEHSWPLANSLSLNGRIDARYTTKQYFDPFNYASTTESGYMLANANLYLTHDRWKIGAWVRNLANRRYFTNMQEFYTDNLYTYSFGAPRTYGVRFEVAMR